jgi:hypothetical protein
MGPEAKYTSGAVEIWMYCGRTTSPCPTAVTIIIGQEDPQGRRRGLLGSRGMGLGAQAEERDGNEPP